MGRNINTYPLVPEPSLNDKLLGSQNNIGTTYNWTISQVSSLINSSESLTRDEMLDLISDPLESLTVSRFYKIIDADSSTEEVIVQAVSSDALSEICLQVSDPSNLYRYVIENDTLTVFSGGGGGIPEAPQDGTTYGRKDAAWEAVVTTLPQSVERTYDPLIGLTFDVMEGAIYNAQTPSNSPTIAIDTLTPAKRGCVVAFYNDGSVEPTITGATPNPRAGTWISGQVNVYWFMWDGHSFTQNIQVQAVVLPDVDTPTFTLLTGATARSVGYSALATGNASSAIMEISDSPSTGFEAVDAADYTYGNTSGDVLGTGTSFFPLVDGTTYYIKVTSSLANYNDASATESAVASGLSTFSPLPIILATAGDTENVITLTTAALPTPDSDTLEFRNVTLGGTFASVPTYGGMPYTHTGLTNGEEYEYRYTAIKAGYNSAEATSSGTPYVFTNAKSGDFNGVDTDVAVASYEPSLTFGNGGTDKPFSISFWYNVNSKASTNRLMALKNAANNLVDDISLIIYSSSAADANKIRFNVRDNSGNVLSLISSAISPFGSWVNIVMSYDGLSLATGLNLYVNNVIDASAVKAGTGTYGGMETIAGAWHIGNNGLDTSLGEGLMDEISIWSKELDSGEVGEIWNLGAPGHLTTHSEAANLQLWTRFEDDVLDASGNNIAMAAPENLTYSTDVA